MTSGTAFSQYPEILWLFGLFALLFIAKLIPVRKTSLHSFEPPSDRADASLKAEDLTDILSIPVSPGFFSRLAGKQASNLVADATGLTIPTILLDNKALVRALEKQGKQALRLPWADIGTWTVFSDRSDLTLRTHGHAIFQYELSLSNTVSTDGLSLIRINRRFTADEERHILAFAGKQMGHAVQFTDW